jgi:hypothetical protein
MTAESQYPELYQLMGGWFHQDYSIEGDTLEEIVGAYLKVVWPKQRQALVDDIERFLRTARDVDVDFETVFRPQIIPTGFAPTTRDFLERIAALARP